MKDGGVNKEDADFKRAINELKIRKKALEDQVEAMLVVRINIVNEFHSDCQVYAQRRKHRSIENGRST
jgi:hypothetical protein